MSRAHVMQTTMTRRNVLQTWDLPLILVVMMIVSLGLVMVTSASIPLADKQLGQPFYYAERQFFYICAGIAFGLLLIRVPMQQWQKAGPMALALAFVMLIAVILPGVGKQVNGSTRWISLGFFQLQVSELAKMLILIYMAGYLVRRGDEVRATLRGFIKPMLVLALLVVLLLMEPDFGAAVVLLATALGMMYMAGVGWFKFASLLMVTASSMAVLAFISPYRLARLLSFLNPWDDPYKSGFQLTQSLIAFGRGEWLGVGLGGSIQKLFYLPETHTDFLYAVIAEELGLFGAIVVILLFSVLVWRALQIGARAERAQAYFSAYLAYGIGIWIGLQAFVNMGVNMGVLPTKGLTLPLMSYGGSSIVVTLGGIALLLRIGHESMEAEQSTSWQKKAKVSK